MCRPFDAFDEVGETGLGRAVVAVCVELEDFFGGAGEGAGWWMDGSASAQACGRGEGRGGVGLPCEEGLLQPGADDEDVPGLVGEGLEG